MKNLLDQHKLNFIIDMQWGSCGKGWLTSVLCKLYDIDASYSMNRPNAGHTIEFDGNRYVYKVLPSSSMWSKHAIILPDSAFYINRLFEELQYNPNINVYIHPHAMIVTEEDKKNEEQNLRSIASTMQGSASAYINKVMRKAKLAKDYQELQKYTINDYPPLFILKLLRQYKHHLVEIPQGFTLSLDHGLYPYTTGRNVTVHRAMDSVGLSHHHIGKVIGIIRPYPIRVGNIEGGYSGGYYSDQDEITWNIVAENSGMPLEEIMKHEITTVTKRVRRVFTFSIIQFLQAMTTIKPDYVIVNFAQYIDSSIYKKNNQTITKLPEKVKSFISLLESFDANVVMLGTGPSRDDYILL